MRASRWIATLALVAFTTGCASTGADKNYLAQLEAFASIERSKNDVEKQKSATEAARYAAMQAIASSANADTTTRVTALFALGLQAPGALTPLRSAAPVPNLPASDADRALQWAQVFAGPLTNIATGYFGYRLGVQQSNNAADVSIAGTNALAGTAGKGFDAAAAIAAMGFNSNSTISSHIQAPQPNVTISGSGVVGDGTYTGPNSGENSGNSGTIGNQNRATSPNNCAPAALGFGSGAPGGC